MSPSSPRKQLPPTRHGYSPWEVISAMQKTVRRGDVDGTMYWAAELDASGYTAWMWKRMLVFASEDIGPAEPPEFFTAIWNLRQLHKEMSRRDPSEGRLQVLHAAYLLATAKKSRAIVMACCYYYTDTHPHLEIPDEALDRHTQRGRRMGRGWEHFQEEGDHLENHTPMPEEAEWERAGYAAILREAPEINPPVMRPERNATEELFDRTQEEAS